MPSTPASLFLLSLLHQPSPLEEGTQPNELSILPEPSSNCTCHFDFDNTATTEPGQAYRATAMSQSARDPIFKAALEVAFNDRPELSEVCIRCHVPRGWLAGRSTPPDGSALIDEDMEGITCDICHRMVPDQNTTLLGDGRYTISQSTSKRANRDFQPSIGHNISQNTYTGSPEACAICHSLFNPFEQMHDPDGNDLGFLYYEQRTYEEYTDSVYPSRDTVCIDCHMERTEGYSCSSQDNLYPDLRVHAIVGGNALMPRMVSMLYPALGLAQDLPELERRVQDNLAKAATLEVRSTHDNPQPLDAGETLNVDVRLTNKTGHKLPTGYPEGRRVFLQVSIELDDGRDPIIVSGRWDQATGDVVQDMQIRTYDTGHAVVGSGRSPHLALANQVLWDTRIPPEGFDPSYADMVPFGRDYGSGPPYRNYDEHSYAIPMPTDVVGTVSGKIVIRAMHLIFAGYYYDFLIDQLPPTSPARIDLETVWAATGHAPPTEMMRVELPIEVTEVEFPPDAGASADAGAGSDSGTSARDGSSGSDEDGGTPPIMNDGGCGCDVSGGPLGPGAAWLGLVLLSLPWLRRRR